jgi:hypothetical protein
MQNYLKKSVKNLQDTLFLNTPKWLSISGPSHLAHAKTGKAPKNSSLFNEFVCNLGFF